MKNIRKILRPAAALLLSLAAAGAMPADLPTRFSAGEGR